MKKFLIGISLMFLLGSCEEKDGKNVDVDLAIETKQGSSFFKQIIESFEAADDCLRYWEYIVFKTSDKKRI